jgi:hypothetical protein
VEVRVWQSFSCNNSSSYRLVARFADPKKAAEAKAELDKFFETHAEEMDNAADSSDFFARPYRPLPAAAGLANKYGFKWKQALIWGDDALSNDLPTVATEGDVLVVYHSYCGGFGKELPLVLKARGAKDVEREEDGDPTVSVLFAIPPGGAKLAKDLAKAFSSADEEGYLEDVKMPWSRRELYGQGVLFNDGKTIGFCLDIDADDFDKLKAWLTKNKVKNPSIRLCEYGDMKKFRAIANAKCECGGALEYLDPRIHKTPTEQLACSACGGMFEVSTFLKKKKPKPKKKT